MKKIAVMEDFLTPEHRKRVLAAAEKHGRGTEAAAEKRGSETAGISFRRQEAAAKAGKQGRE